jgi:hypothetical protein
MLAIEERSCNLCIGFVILGLVRLTQNCIQRILTLLLLARDLLCHDNALLITLIFVKVPAASTKMFCLKGEDLPKPRILFFRSVRSS